MHSSLRLAIAAFAPLAFSTSWAGAQAPAAGADGCEEAPGAAAYQRCALWLDGQTVRRGASGDVAARPGLFRPAALTRVVVGDSARAIAGVYEASARRASLLSTVAVLLAFGAAAIFESDQCEPDVFGFCTDSDHTNETVGVLLLSGGVIAMFASVQFNLRATHALGRAVWWHNARFTR